MKVALYAHKWHYIDNYFPMIQQLKMRGINFDIIILWTRNDNYEKYKREYGDNLIEPYYAKWGNLFANPSNSIPRIFRHTAKAVFFLYTLQKTFRRKKYDILVSSDDRAITHCIVMSAAKAMGLSTVMYPIESILCLEDFLEDRVETTSNSTITSKAMSLASKLIFAQNVKKYKNVKIFRYRPREVLELYPLDILSKNPWARGANKKTDFVAANSQIQKKEDCENGDMDKKTWVTGFPPHDAICSILKKKMDIQKRIFTTLSIPRKRIFLIIGLHYYIPAYKPHEYRELDREFNRVLNTLVVELGDEYNFVLKVHPQRPLLEQKNAIEKKYHKYLSFIKDEFSSYELIAASDAVLNFYSSTTISALATEGPIFCYHLLKKTSPFQKWLRGFRSISFISNTKELSRAIKKLKNNSMRKELQNYRERDRNLYGKFDGKNTERFINLLDLIYNIKSKSILRPSVSHSPQNFFGHTNQP